MINKQRKPNKVMMTKKNYKEDDHFEQFYSAVLPASNGSKCTLYYRRHIHSPKTNQKNELKGLNLYKLMNNSGKELTAISQQAQKKMKQFPIDRTLQVLTFDDNLNLQIGKRIFRKLGKIRKFQSGEGSYKQRTIYYILIVYKFEYDLVKAFRQQYLQAIINQQLKIMNLRLSEQQMQEYRVKLIQDHLEDQAIENMKKVKAVQDDGFQAVTDRFGNFKMDFQSNQKFIEKLPQVKKMKKKILKAEKAAEKTRTDKLQVE